jgi:glycosyltransferase involved in cell wall biosynthesis
MIPPGVDFSQLSWESSPEPYTIAYPGRITRYKGALRAVEILGGLSKELGAMKLLLSAKQTNGAAESEGYLSNINEMAAKFPLLSVQFLSNTDSAYTMYQTSAVTLCLSEYEGFGLAPLESLACGCPVVARPVGGMEWLRGVKGAACVDHIEDVPHAVQTVLEDLPKWRSEAVAGRERLKRKYDIHVIAQRYLSMLVC